jgi:hypothetical protein
MLKYWIQIKPLFPFLKLDFKFSKVFLLVESLCGLVVRVLGYRTGGPDSIPGTTIKK